MSDATDVDLTCVQNKQTDVIMQQRTESTYLSKSVFSDPGDYTEENQDYIFKQFCDLAVLLGFLN